MAENNNKGIFKVSWNEKTILEKYAFVIGMISAVAVIILAVLQLKNVWSMALYIAEPLLGVMMVCQAISQWRRSKAISIFSIIVAIFLFGVSLYMYVY